MVDQPHIQESATVDPSNDPVDSLTPAGAARVAVFGGGVAGLTAAAALHLHGYQCQVFERRQADGAAGMGIVLSAEAIADLAGAGLDPPEASPPFRTLGVALRRYCSHHPDGAIRYVEDIPDGWRGVPRGEVIAALQRRLPAGAVVHGAELAELAIDPDGTVTGARRATGEAIQANLYVAADGAHSLARRKLYPDWPERLAPVRELVGMVDCPPAREWVGNDLHKFQTPGHSIGILPVGDGMVGWFMQFDSERFPPPPDTVAGRRAFAQQLVGGWADPVPELLRATDFAMTHLWHPIDADLVPRFHSGNLVLLGDAAHPLLPFTSQGVSAAIAGARELATRLRAAASMPAAFAGYSAACRARCAPFVARGRELTKAFLAEEPQAAHTLPLAIPTSTGPR